MGRYYDDVLGFAHQPAKRIADQLIRDYLTIVPSGTVVRVRPFHYDRPKTKIPNKTVVDNRY